MGRRYAGFTLRTECNKCGMPLPVDRPAPEVTCSQCNATVRLPNEVWRRAFELFEGDERPVRGTMRTINETIGGFRVHLQVANIAPKCEKCAAPYAVDQFAADASEDFACTKCGDPASLWPAPSWVASIVPTVRHVISTDPGGATVAAGTSLDEPVVEAIKPVAMPCPQCSGALSITTEHERILACQYCGTDVFLPDEIWRRLHPVKQVQWFYASFEGKTALELQREEEAVKTAEAKAKFAARAAEAWKAVPMAWAGVVVFALWQAAMPVLVMNRGELVGVAGSQTKATWMIVGITVFLYFAMMALAARPLSIADRGSVRNHMLGYGIVGIMFAPPVAGALFAIIAAFIVFGKRDNKNPASGIGRPVVMMYVLLSVLPQFLFAYFVITGAP